MITLKLSPLKRAPKPMEFIAVSVDGNGSRGGFRAAYVYDESGLQYFTSASATQAALFQRRNRGKVILAYDLEFTYATLFQPFSAGWSILMANGNWLKAVFTDGAKHSFTAWDIKRIAPLDVSDMARCTNLSYDDSQRSRNSSNLAATSQRTDISNADVHIRTGTDPCIAEIVYRFAVLYQAELNRLGGQIKMTAASCAMDLFRRQFLHQDIAPTWPDRNLVARACYYGGRVENFRVGTATDVTAYDINSLYPSVMRNLEVGLPSTYHRIVNPRRLYTYLQGFGQFAGVLDIPVGFASPLPVRANGRLYFPYGRLSGSWTFSEVRHALACGGKIVSCDWVIFAEDTIQPFRAYVDTLYSLKTLYRSAADPRAEVVKLLLNSLYGKFGQHSDSGLQSLEVPLGDFDLEDYQDCEPHTLGGYLCFLRDIAPNVQSPHVQVLWAAEITAQARIALHQFLQPLDTAIAYCDTDSIHTSASLPVSDVLGQLKPQYDFGRVSYFAPKEYGGMTRDGHFIAHAKGIPTDKQAEYLASGHVNFSRPLRTLESLAHDGRIASPKATLKYRRANPCNRLHAHMPDYNATAIETYPARWPLESLSCND